MSIHKRVFTILLKRTTYFCISVLLLISTCDNKENSTIHTSSGNITGSVIDKLDSTLIYNAEIILNPIQLHTYTDSLGCFLFFDIEPGFYTILVNKDGYFTDSLNCQVQEDDTTEVTFSLNYLSGVIIGTVLSKSANEIISNSLVYTKPATSEVLTDQYGYFIIENIRPQVYQVFVECENYFMDSSTTIITELDTTEIDFLLGKKCKISGIVKGDGNLVYMNGYPANIKLTQGGVVKYESISRSSGECYFFDIREGIYKLEVIKGFFMNEAYSTEIVNVNSFESYIGDIYLDSIRYDYFPLEVGNYYKYKKYLNYSEHIPAHTMEDEGYIYNDVYSYVEFSVSEKEISNEVIWYYLDEIETVYYKKRHFKYFDGRDSIIVDSTITITDRTINISEKNGVFTSSAFIGNRSFIAFHLIVDHHYVKFDYSYGYKLEQGPSIVIGDQSYLTLCINRYDQDKFYYSRNIGLTKYEENYVGSSLGRYILIDLIEFEIQK